METFYNVGPNNNISINLIVDTEGVAQSTVFQKRIDLPKLEIVSSTGLSGNIINHGIGNSMSLINSFIVVVTSIHFIGISTQNLESAVLNTRISLSFSGGLNGNTNIALNKNNDFIISEDKKQITFIKLVIMIA